MYQQIFTQIIKLKKIVFKHKSKNIWQKWTIGKKGLTLEKNRKRHNICVDKYSSFLAEYFLFQQDYEQNMTTFLILKQYQLLHINDNKPRMWNYW